MHRLSLVPASGRQKTDQSDEARYIEISRRMVPITSAGAFGIFLLTLAAAWGDRPRMATIVCVQLALLPFNIWVTLRLLPQKGARTAETMRSVVNLAGTILIGSLAGWPLPIWLWLPFVAMSHPHLGSKTASALLVTLALVMDVSALYAGVPWIYPATFTALAVFCSMLAKVRVRELSMKLSEADTQRIEIEIAHTETRAAHDRLSLEMRAREHVEIELRESHKLEAVGRLASGIAHEINTPVQFVSDSVKFMEIAIQDLLALVDHATEAKRALREGKPASDVAAELDRAEEELDVLYLTQNLPLAIARSLDGLGRVATIVQSMKTFAHPGNAQATRVDLKGAILSTLTIARSEYKHVADVETVFDDLPLIMCNVGELNQVILNLVVNAAHAINDVVKGGQTKGKITVCARLEPNAVVISVADTGTGIPAEAREHIFEPFFTTKQVGRGTGQGLALARAVVVKHQGSLSFTTEVGVGTTFFIRLPVHPALGSQVAA